MSLEEKMDEYMICKDIVRRTELLKEITFSCPEGAKDFFYKAFKKERYLDAKLTAVRGYAVYSGEQEVDVLMEKMIELLKKRPEHTPYDYQEYEVMRSAYLMPYLIKKYNYQCFYIFHEQLEKQYDAMPDVFKNIFSCDEYGKSYNIRDPKEVNKSLREFFNES